jgi:hypothetical protein
MWSMKLRIMFAIGATSSIFGVVIRYCAKFWSKDINGIADPDMRLNIIEAGTWGIAFGLLVLALILNRWVAGDPEKPTPDQQR